VALGQGSEAEKVQLNRKGVMRLIFDIEKGHPQFSGMTFVIFTSKKYLLLLAFI
jgi:hypothetical protein